MFIADNFSKFRLAFFNSFSEISLALRWKLQTGDAPQMSITNEQPIVSLSAFRRIRLRTLNANFLHFVKQLGIQPRCQRAPN